MNWLKELDTDLLLWINGRHSPATDYIFHWVSNRAIWIPFYLILATSLYRHFRKEFLKILLSVAVLIFLSDQVSVLIKDQVMRYRPCYNLHIKDKLAVIDGCGGLYGFVSSHAANSMALSAFLMLFAGKSGWPWTPGLIAWLLLVSYSRVYLGRHYPADVVGGWILGLSLALIIFYFYRKLSGRKTGPL